MSSFLDLPLELRLIIYEFAAVEGSAVTIGAAQLVGSGPELVYRKYGENRSPLPGLPNSHEAVIQSGYASRLLSVSNPPQIHVPAETSEYLDPNHHSTLASLLLLNHQINVELTTHLRVRKNRKTSLFVSFPLGLHVFKTLCPDFVRQAQSIHLAGTYIHTAKASVRAIQTAQLGALVRATVGPKPSYPVTKFEARFYFPGGSSYSNVWDDASPVSTVLSNVAGGYIDMEVARGKHGAGVLVSVRPHPEGVRAMSTVWRRLVEGDCDKPKCGDWAVDKSWPEWTTEFVPSTPVPAY